MKKILMTIMALMVSVSANAFFGANNDMEFPLSDDNKYDNGMFAYNGYDFFDPRWFSTEFTNMVNEIDDDGDMFGSNYDDHRSQYNFPTK